MARVLIIEDEPNIALILKIAISDEGHDTVTARTGLEGLELLLRQPAPDIVFIDLNLPGMNGQAVVNTMRSISKLKNIPVVIMSGCIEDSNNFPPRESYSTLISKPFDLDVIIQTIENLTSPVSTFYSPVLAD